MNRFRRLTIAVSLSLALVSVPAMALATHVTETVQYSISGVELPGATPDKGSFAGVAVAFAPFDYGTWLATIEHTGTLITGGIFFLDGNRHDVRGGFVWGGSLTLTSPVGDCTKEPFNKETFTVIGDLLVGGGTGKFIATLTHYRKFCTTYFATVRGSVTFSFSL